MTLAVQVDPLFLRAQEAAGLAYAPYSQFRVGAALEDAAGHVFAGCNVESESYGLTICAERVAVFSAVAAGAVRPFARIAVSCGSADGPPCTPCGACRQVLVEHFRGDAQVILGPLGDVHRTVAALLPDAFHL